MLLCLPNLSLKSPDCGIFFKRPLMSSLWLPQSAVAFFSLAAFRTSFTRSNCSRQAARTALLLDRRYVMKRQQ